MGEEFTMQEKYEELLRLGYVSPQQGYDTLEMPTAFIEMPTFISDHTIVHETAPGNSEDYGQLDRYITRNQSGN